MNQLGVTTVHYLAQMGVILVLPFHIQDAKHALKLTN